MIDDGHSRSVLIERTGSVLRVTLARPERRNALGLTEMHTVTDAVLDASAPGSGVRAIRLGGSGTDFCAGGDLIEGGHTTSRERAPGQTGVELSQSVQRLVSALWETPVPVVTAVRGHAIGLGAALVMASDLAVAARSTRLRFPFNQHGFTPDSGVSWLLPRFIGVARAKRALFMGEEFTAEDALAAGLVAAVVDDDDLERVVDDWVEKLATGATLAIGATKQLVRDGIERSLLESLRAEADAMESSVGQRDFREGLEAFVTRRAPSFEGR